MVNSLNEVKEKQKNNDISDITSNRNTMDNTNPFITSNIDNSSVNITSNIIPEKKISNFQDNQFITGQNNNNNNLQIKIKMRLILIITIIIILQIIFLQIII